MKAYEIADIIENYCPTSLAEEWDNVGLLCGSDHKEVNRVLITLDPTEECVRYAAQIGADMIISHHPILFKPIQRIDFSTPTGRILELLIKNDINLYAAHTNMDICEGGINDALAGVLGINDVQILDDSTGIGRIGTLGEEMTLAEFAEAVQKKLPSPCMRVCAKENKTVRTAAVASGSCSEVIPAAIKKGADVIVTGDLKYHECIDFVNEGIALIDAGHYPTEIIVTRIFKEILTGFGLEISIFEGEDIFRGEIK